MRRVNYEDILHGATNDSILEVLHSVESIRFVSRLDEAMEARGMTQTKLSTLTGLRQATISEFISGEKSAMTKAHLLVLMIALRITDIRELIDIEFDIDIKEQFEREAKAWTESKNVPLSLHEVFNNNTNRMSK